MNTKHVSTRHTRFHARLIARSLPIAAIVCATVALAGPLASGASAATPPTCAGYAVTISGTDGNDTLYGTSGRDVIHGGAGNDLIFGRAGNDVICGGDGYDQIGGEGGADLLDGGTGVDAIDFQTESGPVSAWLSTGRATGADGALDSLYGFENLNGSAFADTLAGDNSNNRISGNAGDDRLYGYWGHDFIGGGAGNDTMIGELGVDVIDEHAAPAAVVIDLTAGRITGEGTDTISGFESAHGSPFNDTLIGDANANTLIGFDGDDFIEGRSGNDLLDGANGVDRVSFANAPAAVIVDLSLNSATGDGTDSVLNMENITGSRFDDYLKGNAGANDMWGGAGVDAFLGMAGNDTFWGNTADGDQVQYVYAPAAVTVDLRAGTASGGDGNDRFTGMRRVVGSPFADTLYGTDGDDSFVGYTGNDTIDGRLGFDGVKYNWLPGGVVANLTTGVATQGTNDTDKLMNIESLGGSAYNDVLTGSAGKDSLTGREGNDLIYGLGGDDDLAGNEGTDTCDGGLGFDRGHVTCESRPNIEQVYEF